MPESDVNTRDLRTRDIPYDKYEIPPDPQHWDKFNPEKAMYIQLSEEGLDSYQQKYGEVTGEPKFLHDFLKERPSQQLETWLKHSELMTVTDDKKFLVMPNAPYVDHDQKVNSPESLKDNPDGFALVAWYIHPDKRDSRVLSEEGRQELKEELEKKGKEEGYNAYRYTDKEHQDGVAKSLRLSNSKSMDRSDSQADFGTISQRSGHGSEDSPKFIASILDLEKKDVPALKQLKETTQELLSKSYGVTDEDQTRMFFHFPYAEATVTLHLHARVNSPVAELDDNRSFLLDDVIDSLEQNGSRGVRDLILSRTSRKSKDGTEQMPGIATFIKKSEGMDFYMGKGLTVESIDNPYYDPTKKQGLENEPMIDAGIVEDTDMKKIPKYKEQDKELANQQARVKTTDDLPDVSSSTFVEQEIQRRGSKTSENTYEKKSDMSHKEKLDEQRQKAKEQNGVDQGCGGCQIM